MKKRRTKHKKQFCPKGHDTFIVGREKRGTCKECVRKYKEKYRLEHLEEIAEYLALYYIEHKDELSDNMKQWRKEHEGELKEYFIEYGNKNKKKLKIKHQKYYEEHKDEILKKAKKHNKENPELVKSGRLKRTYGITLEQYNLILEKQDSRCAGCLVHKNRVDKYFAVDHDHSCCAGRKSCGQCIRGLLCSSCNMVLGGVEDNLNTLLRLVTYLKKHKIKEKK